MPNRSFGPGQDVFGPSQSLWAQVPWDQIFAMRDRTVGWGAYDDFTNYGAVNAAIASSLGNYVSEGNPYRTFELYGSSNSTQSIVVSNTQYTVPTGYPIFPNQVVGSVTGRYPAGAILPTPGQIVFTPAAANDQAQIQMGGSTAALNSCPFLPYTAANYVSGPVFFECRLKVASLTTAINNFFIGLGSAGCAVTSVPAATGAISTTPGLLGFGWIAGDDSNVISTIYNRAGGTVQKASFLTLASTCLYGGVYCVATSYFKLGFKYDPASGILTPYVNGIPFDGHQGPNKLITSAYTTAAAWPNAPMALTAGLFHDASGTYTQTVTLDWWAAAQLAA